MTRNHKCICDASLSHHSYSAHFTKAQCANCGCVQFAPASQDTVTFQYDSSDEKYGNESYLRGSEFRWSHDVIMNFLRNKQGKVLEIGSFNGFFVDRLRRQGFDAVGFDLNVAAVNAGREVYGLKENLYCDLSEALACGPFDAIIMIDVLEHIEDAADFLNSMTRALNSAGVILIAGPTSERPFFDKTDFPPHHLWRFTRRGLVIAGQHRNLASDVVDIEYDAALLLRNVIGRLLNGYSKKEYFGEGPSVTNDKIPAPILFISKLCQRVFRPILKMFGVSYCSAVIAMHRA